MNKIKQWIKLNNVVMTWSIHCLWNKQTKNNQTQRSRWQQQVRWQGRNDFERRLLEAERGVKKELHRCWVVRVMEWCGRGESGWQPIMTNQAELLRKQECRKGRVSFEHQSLSRTSSPHSFSSQPSRAMELVADVIWTRLKSWSRQALWRESREEKVRRRRG